MTRTWTWALEVNAGGCRELEDHQEAHATLLSHGSHTRGIGDEHKLIPLQKSALQK